MWQELEGSKMLSRIIQSQWRCRLGSAMPLEHCG